MIRHFAIAALLFTLTAPTFADGPAVDDEIAALEAQIGELKKCLTPAQIAANNRDMLVELTDEVAETAAEPMVTAPATAEITPPEPAVPEQELVDYC